MIPLRARILASRHEALLGRPLRSRRVSAGVLLPCLLWGMPLAISALLWWQGGGLDALEIALIVLVALVMAIAHLAVIDPRLVICERGLILGRMIPLPFSPTFVISGREIEPGSVRAVPNAESAAREAGYGRMFFQFLLYGGSPGVPAVMFRGPWGADVTMGRTAVLHRPNPESPFLFAHRAAPQIAREIQQMLAR